MSVAESHAETKRVRRASRHGWRGEEVVGSTTKPRRVPVGERLRRPKRRIGVRLRHTDHIENIT